MDEVEERLKCKYELEYYDHFSSEIKIFKCDEDAVKDGYCIFHHPEYWKEHKGEVRGKFMSKVEDAIRNKKELLCIGYNLPEIVLLQKRFAMPVYFNHAVFHKEANFFGAKFSDADFTEAKFSKATFNRVEFSDHAIFLRTEFSDADFFGAKFSRAEFNVAKFSEADFHEAEFSDYVAFDGAEFSDYASFIRAKFSKAYFTRAKFSEVNFNGAKFSRADFIGAKFSDATFNGVEFFDAIFDGAEFSKASFTGAKFSGADFTGAEFSRTDFSEAEFFGRAVFDFSTFLGHAEFKNSDFSPDLLMNDLDPYSMISFRSVKFEKPEDVVFDNCDMRRVSFINTNIERIKFRNVKWKDYKIYDEKLFLLKESEKEREKFIEDGKRKLSKISNMSNEDILKVVTGKEERDEIKEEIVKELKFRIPNILLEINALNEKERRERTDEEEKRYNELIEKCIKEIEELKNGLNKAVEKNSKEIEEGIKEEVVNDGDLTLENVLAVYRALRENYDYYLKYDESGRFFINEMDLKKAYSNPVEKIVMWVYKLLCLYGESFTRTLCWIAIAIVLFAILRTPNLTTLNVEDLHAVILGFLDSLKISLAAFFQIYYDNSLLTILERITSIPILGSLYIALKRKLERRVRH